jgi:ADP-ribose pyrophosphatase YjhB (NUDIX family)
MNYCSQCGSAQLERTIPLGDIGLRYSCPVCGVIHYQRHSIVAGCIPIWGDRVLLCRRAIEPFIGSWTIPAGYVEIGETLEEAAARETREETGAIASTLELFAVYNLPMFSEVYTLFLAQVESAAHACGDETQVIGWFARNEIPWSSIAFPMVREALRAWSEQPRSPQVHTADFFWGPEGAVRVKRRKT